MKILSLPAENLQEKDFTLTKTTIFAKDFGKEWFSNGYSWNNIHRLYLNGVIIATLNDTTGKNKIANIHIADDVFGNKIIYWVKFSTKPIKGDLNISISA